MQDDEKTQGPKPVSKGDVEFSEGSTRSGSFDDDTSSRPELIVTQPDTSDSDSTSDSEKG